MYSDKNIIKMFNGLSLAEQNALLNELSASQLTTAINAREIRNDVLMSCGITCVYCSSPQCTIFCRSQNTRYKCKDCKRTFRASAGTPLHGSHKPEVWQDYIKFFLLSYSIRDCAKELKISKTTAFKWRRKLLSALEQISWNSSYNGVVEVSEMRFDYLDKSPCPKDFSNQPQISTIITYERSAGVCKMQLLEPNKPSESGLDNCFKNQLDFAKMLVYKGDVGSLKNWSNQRYITCWKGEQFMEPEHSVIYHLRNIENIETQFLKWFKRFCGVSSKYLNGYLCWFNALQAASSIVDKISKMLKFVLTSNKSIFAYRNADLFFKLFMQTSN